MSRVKIEYAESDDDIEITDVKVEYLDYDDGQSQNIHFTIGEDENGYPHEFNQQNSTNVGLPNCSPTKIKTEHILPDLKTDNEATVERAEHESDSSNAIFEEPKIDDLQYSDKFQKLGRCKDCKREMHPRGLSKHKRYCQRRLIRLNEKARHFSTTDEVERIVRTSETKTSTSVQQPTPQEGVDFSKPTPKPKNSGGNSSQTLTCPECSKTFCNKTLLKVHKCRANQNVEFKIFCEVCGRYFVSSKALELHLSNCHGGKLFRCQYCRMTFEQKSELKYHKIEMHGASEFPCEHCSKTFLCAFLLGKHLRARHWGQTVPGKIK